MTVSLSNLDVSTKCIVARSSMDCSSNSSLASSAQDLVIGGNKFAKIKDIGVKLLFGGLVVTDEYICVRYSGSCCDVDF